MPRKPLDNRRAERAFAIPALAQQTGTVAHNCRATCTKSSEYTTKVRKSLTQVFKELKSEDFIYVDRGDIVNLAHIMGIKDQIVELKNGIRLSASHSKLDQIKSRLSEFWGEQI